MVETVMSLRVGDVVPGEICLPDIHGQEHCVAQWRGHIVVLVFWSAECPVSREYDEHYFIPRYSTWQAEGILVFGVDSNANYDVARIQAAVAERQTPYPILRDEGHRLADLLAAQTTPHVFLLNPEGRLVYAGAVDDRSFRRKVPTRVYLDEALAAVKAGRQPDPAVTPPYGCTIVRSDTHEH